MIKVNLKNHLNGKEIKDIELPLDMKQIEEMYSALSCNFDSDTPYEVEAVNVTYNDVIVDKYTDFEKLNDLACELEEQ